MAAQQAQPSDVGFGYISNEPVQQHATLQPNMNAPLKSALKSPGTPGRMLNPLSPTFKEEQILEKHEEETEREQVKDLVSHSRSHQPPANANSEQKVKTRVRMAKMMLRGVNFSCSLIVLALIATTFTIFNATKHLPPRNGLPAWSANSKPWPQILLLVIACVSLVFAVGIFYAYARGGHKRAEKAAVYYTIFAVFFFAFSIIMWAVGAAVLNSSRNNGNGQDVWGWSCKDNKRRELFKDDVGYALVCRLQEWSLVCCIIEIVVETITIAIYAIVFYRFWSKRKLRKSMDVRDKARSDLYLAQLRSQSAPNTPGFAQSMRSPVFPSKGGADEYSAAENGNFYAPSPASAHGSSPFKLQAPPIKVHHATPRAPQEGFAAAPSPSVSPPPPQERQNEHVAAAPGEQTYAAVPIPGAYASPLVSPALQPQHGSMAAQMQRGPGSAF
jgi:hypothetical protein